MSTRRRGRAIEQRVRTAHYAPRTLVCEDGLWLLRSPVEWDPPCWYFMTVRHPGDTPIAHLIPLTATDEEVDSVIRAAREM